MIKFSGEMSEISKKLIVRANRLSATTAGAIVAGLLLIPVVIVAFTWHLIVLLFLIPLILTVALAGIPPKDLNRIVPCEVMTEEFDDGVYLVAALTNGEYTKKRISSVKKVVDRGESYQIYFTSIPSGFLCQKDLLVEGTLEEFEQLFDGKIIRK